MRINESYKKRIQKLAGIVISEITNPYSVEWVVPDVSYFNQELDELLGNEMRFSKAEFFHPTNYDIMYQIMPYTFKKIAEHSSGKELKSPQQIKEILLDKEINELMPDWGSFRKKLMGDSKCRSEALSIFRRGKLTDWPAEKIQNTFYMGKFKDIFGDWMFKGKNLSSSNLLKQMKDDEGETLDNMKGYEKNIQDFRNERHRELPPAFIMELPTGGRDGKQYNLIGGHKRSTISHQLNVPIKVWFIKI